MNPTEQVKSVSYLKAHAADLIRQVREVREPVIVTQNGEAKAYYRTSPAMRQTGRPWRC